MMVGFLSPELALAGRATGTETPHPRPLKIKAKVHGRMWRAEGQLWIFGSEKTMSGCREEREATVQYPTAVRRDARAAACCLGLV